MSIGDLVAVAVGIAILVFVLADIFLTVLHHWGKSGPIGRQVTHLIWRLALWATRRASPARRRWYLGLVGPTLIPISVALWALLVILGFAFLYMPGIPDGFDRWDRVLPIRGAFGDAFYFSGYSFFTLGYGDIAPVTNTYRVLGIMQSGSGFALITLVISYFVSVYDAYTRKTTLAQSLYYQAGDSADAAELICRLATSGMPPTLLASTVGRLREDLVRLRSEYSNYPILHYFRDPEPSQSFLRLLFFAQDLALLLETAIDPSECPGVADLGRRTGLARAATSAQNALVRTMVRQMPEEVRPDEGDRLPGQDAWMERCRAALQKFRECGLAVRGEDTVLEAYCSGRRRWEPLLRACAEALGEDWEEVTGGC